MKRQPEHAAHSAFTYDRHAQALADIFIRGLESGTAPWVKPWTNSTPTSEAPYNPTTGKAYRGGNAVALMCAEAERLDTGSMAVPDSRWMTYKQASSVGCQVRKGEKGMQLLKWMEVEEPRAPTPVGGSQAEATAEKRLIALPFWVFHASQIDGLPAPPAIEPKPELQMLQEVDDLVKASGAVVQTGGNRALYSPKLDIIRMPALFQFHDMPSAAATLLHELGHWTGHETRLNRTFSFDRKSEDYAREELRAEMASLAMAQRLGVPHDPSQHVAYVGSWIRLLKDDPRELLRAASDVEKILAHLNVPERQHEVLPQVERQQERPGREATAPQRPAHPPARETIAALRAALNEPAGAAPPPPKTRTRSRAMELGR